LAASPLLHDTGDHLRALHLARGRDDREQLAERDRERLGPAQTSAEREQPLAKRRRNEDEGTVFDGRTGAIDACHQPGPFLGMFRARIADRLEAVGNPTSGDRASARIDSARPIRTAWTTSSLDEC